MVQLPFHLEAFRGLPLNTNMWLALIDCHVGSNHPKHTAMKLSGAGATRPYRHINMNIYSPLNNGLSDIKWAAEKFLTLTTIVFKMCLYI